MAWFTVAGKTCVAAYDAVGASSLADSYVDESGSGNNAAPGVAPTWAAGTGWTFNGTTQWLNTGVVPAAGYTIAVRYSGWNGTSNRFVAGEVESPYSAMIGLRLGTSSRYYNGGSGDSAAPSAASGVMISTPAAGYLNGASDAAIGGSWSSTSLPIFIAAYNSGASASGLYGGNVQAVAIYSGGAFSGTEAAALTAAMNALPTAAGGAVPIIMQQEWHAAIFGGVRVG